MRIAVHREIPEDAGLRSQWNALVDTMERPEVFYTYEWAVAVQRAYHSTMVPLLVLAYDDDALVGVLVLSPLTLIRREHSSSRIRRRTIATSFPTRRIDNAWWTPSSQS